MEGGDEQERKGIEGKSFIINDKCSLFHYLIHWMPSLYIILKDHWRLNFNYICASWNWIASWSRVVIDISSIGLETKSGRILPLSWVTKYDST